MRSILFGLTLVVSIAVSGQSTEVRDFVREAETLAQKGDLTKALQAIEAASARCEVDKGAQCEAYIAFASGFVYQTVAEHEVEARRPELLRTAVRFYDQSLAGKETIDALENLVIALLDLGELDRVIELTQSLMRVNPDSAPDYLVAAAAVAQETGDAVRAEQFLRQAIDEDPSLYDAREALVELHLSTDLKSLTAEQRRTKLTANLVLGVDQARNGFADLAIEAYEAVIREAWESSEAQAAEALTEWVDAHASGQNAVPPLSELPGGWTAPPVAQLREIIERPENAAGAAWWMENDVRKHIVASLLSVLVAQSEMELSRTIAVLETADGIAPHPTRYWSRNAPAGLRWRRSPHFDIVAKLAPLYLDNKTGPKDDRFERLTSRLSSRSLKAVLGGDFLTVQRYYATLGLLLDERQIWTGRMNSAGYYLRQAVEVADMRARNHSAEFQALPDLRRRLAEGLAQRNGTKEAAVHYVGAAADYLDMDDLAGARKMYGEAMDLQITSAKRPTGERVAQVRTALEARESVSRLARAADVTFDAIAAHSQFAWLFTRGADDEPFVGRQRYKTLMALADRAEEVIGPDIDDAMRLRLEAVAAARKINALASGLDVENLRKIGRRLILSTNGRSQLKLSPRLSKKQFEKIWTYGGGDRVGGFDIGWDDDLLIAADVLGVLLNLPADVRPKFRVDQEMVTLVPVAASYDLAPVVTQLKKLGDVEDVTLTALSAGR